MKENNVFTNTHVFILINDCAQKKLFQWHNKAIKESNGKVISITMS